MDVVPSYVLLDGQVGQEPVDIAFSKFPGMLVPVELDVPTRKYRTPRYVEEPVTLAGCTLRQLFIQCVFRRKVPAFRE